MFAMLGTVSLLLSIGVLAVAADETQVHINLDNAQFLPSAAWQNQPSTQNDLSGCASPGWTTATTGANVTFQFTGDRLTFSGGVQRVTGTMGAVMHVVVDGLALLTTTVRPPAPADEQGCGTLLDFSVPYGDHNAVLTVLMSNGIGGLLVAPPHILISDISSYGNGSAPSIESFASPIVSATFLLPPLPPPPHITGAAASNDSSGSSSQHTGAIIAAVIGSVFGALLIGAAVLAWLSKRRRAARTKTSPSQQVDLELFPPPYSGPSDNKVVMDVKASEFKLEVPPPSYSASAGAAGLRARSRSPAPDRKSMSVS